MQNLQDGHLRTKSKSSIRRGLDILFFLAAALFFIWQAARYSEDIKQFDWGVSQWLVLVGSMLLGVLNIAVGGLIWWLLLTGQGVKIRCRRIQLIFAIAQFGKYLPGNVGQHVARVYMLRDDGAPVSVVVQTVLLEALMGLGVGAVLALIALSYVLDAAGPEARGLHEGLLIAVALLALVLPWLLPQVLNRFLPSLTRRLSGGALLKPLDLRRAVAVASLFVLSFLILGWLLKAQLSGIFGVHGSSAIELTGLFALIWVAGYLTPGAPAGLGVREALMLLVFGPVYGEAVAIGLGLTLRLATTFGDALAFIVGLGLRRMMAGATRLG